MRFADTSDRMTSKRKPEVQVPAEESDELLIRPLGAGQEVGRSCHLIEFKGKKILLDCGIHPGMHGVASLPFLDMIDPEEIDLLLVSHFHLDHSGGLPYFMEKTKFRGRCFMTHATKAIYRWLLSDYVKVSNISTDDMLYTDADIEKSMSKIETINFHQEMEVNGVRFWCYTAGHVLGAAMFMMEIAGVKILYTGDYSRQEDRHLMAAELPNVHPDIVIIESTYGTHIHENREEREHRFTSLVHDIVNRGGRCLIPVFALGRAQELLLILDEYWSQHPELHDIPIYYASQLAKKCMTVYQTYINAMNEKIRRQISISNPFVFKHIINLKNMEQFEDIGPSVVLASPGMMQSGLSRELFEAWCTDKRNGCIIAGYCVEGTLAKHILSEPSEIQTMSGQKLPLKCSVDYISFSAHADYKQTSEFLRALKPAHVVLVHGEANEMARLKAALIREYEDDPDYQMEVHNPRNTTAVHLHFRGEKMAKVVGELAAKPPVQGHKISGILVKRNFNFHLMAPDDLHSYTDLAMSTVTQRLSVGYTGTVQLLKFYLGQLAGDIWQTTNAGITTLRVFNAITVTLQPHMAIVEWVANPVTDMYADAVVTVILRAERDPVPPKNVPDIMAIDKAHFQECLLETLEEMFGTGCTDKLFQRDRLTVIVDDKQAIINLDTLEVVCCDDALQQVLQSVITRLHQAITPLRANQ
ncbi:cleavage and polyadenylation specificity factor subunit 3-like [Pomacea canaliculata]|uniref:cleavage and polyadenylation specificity factor subunit 3-like n=1 Tax=Pomacea canaliculata TaxID=400727 RepID=UPI000D72F951|nr:cleavage and polyadenylation specificity factor subunit 3-like [Pomacea canaliculata]XP_025086333.1 cleavage and polyadenylation specificity factor subunit 3-like [Pomacea canaliculata]XP_025086334.1 cleavage and polyadenylation specificity factor subunit 3-like [Pomacea canaliculata]XP_025086335.1 cleavage and polyadenylation specificity factor subunit 3-like [Pomacea canaliculata]XP_025086336.1 cleavage and polyadenylation specificity factor subunit 3-like [Pomacea canaliculata]